jgi:hypothetical protein
MAFVRSPRHHYVRLRAGRPEERRMCSGELYIPAKGRMILTIPDLDQSSRTMGTGFTITSRNAGSKIINQGYNMGRRSYPCYILFRIATRGDLDQPQFVFDCHKSGGASINVLRFPTQLSARYLVTGYSCPLQICYRVSQ